MLKHILLTLYRQDTRTMRIPNIYVAQALKENSDCEVGGQAAQHLLKVLRMKRGQPLRLFNGDGRFYPATILTSTKKSFTAQLGAAESSASESRLHTHLGQVMSRGDRMDYAIQKSTEMGVSEITPLDSERCELRLNKERAEKKVQHWQQIAINAAEQCGRASVPTIHPVTSLNDWIQQQTATGLSLVLHHRDQQRLTDISPTPEQVNILIGPEGGLSEQEISLAGDNKFVATTFGPRVLRTETAPIVCLSLLQWLWGDFKS